VSDPRAEWDDLTVRTVRVDRDRALPPTYALAPSPGEPPVAMWRFDALVAHELQIGEHAHDFPVLVYLEQARGTLEVGARSWALSAGDVIVVAPGDSIGPFDTSAVEEARGWAVSFTPDALGPDVAGSYLAWRTHPMLFPFVGGGPAGALRLTVPAPDRDHWVARMQAMHGELTGRPDGYREAVLAHLVLLLVGVSRLAADVVDDLRVNREPLLAEVFAVIEQRYAERLSLREVARAVSVSPGHLTSTVRRRTGRTVQQWITERRMVQARRLLSGTELPINEVGRRVGYPDAGYFARLFGRAHGVSPARWRGAVLRS
jgi:AraC family transcriptional regulator, transcriptional activator of pobA